jgi:hypothetical protein
MGRCFRVFRVFPLVFRKQVGECFRFLRRKHYLPGVARERGCFPERPRAETRTRRPPRQTTIWNKEIECR